MWLYSISVPPFYFQDVGSSLLSILWILFLVDHLYSLNLFDLVDFYHVSSSTACFCLFISFNVLCLGSPLCRLQVVVLVICRVLPSSWVGPVPHEGFLVEGASVCVLVGRAGSGLSEGPCLVMDSIVFLFCCWFGIRHQHYSLLVYGWGMVLVLSWRPLGEFFLINVPGDF